MTLPKRPALRVGELPGQEAMTSLDAFKAARMYLCEMHTANLAYDGAADAGSGEAGQWDAMEAFDTAANALLGLLTILEKRGVLKDVGEYLEATYGRV